MEQRRSQLRTETRSGEEREVLCERCKRPLGEKALGGEVVNKEKNPTKIAKTGRKMTLKEAAKVPKHERVLVIQKAPPKTRAEQEAWLKKASGGRFVFAKV